MPLLEATFVEIGACCVKHCNAPIQPLRDMSSNDENAKKVNCNSRDIQARLANKTCSMIYMPPWHCRQRHANAHSPTHCSDTPANIKSAL